MTDQTIQANELAPGHSAQRANNYCACRFQPLPSRLTSSIGDCSGAERLSGSRRSEEENAFWGIDTQVDESLWMQKRNLNHFAKLLDLLFTSADIRVSHVGLLFDLMEGGVDGTHS